jgi:hypothetical protein
MVGTGIVMVLTAGEREGSGEGQGGEAGEAVHVFLLREGEMGDAEGGEIRRRRVSCQTNGKKTRA